MERSAVYDQGAGGGAVSDINQDRERTNGERGDNCGEVRRGEKCAGEVQAGDAGGDGEETRTKVVGKKRVEEG